MIEVFLSNRHRTGSFGIQAFLSSPASVAISIRVAPREECARAGLVLTQRALLGHEQTVFAWLEAVVPPMVVLSTAYVLKGQMLEAIEQRHAAERAFQSALAEWQTVTANPEQQLQWTQFYANALQDALRKANARRKEILVAMTQDDWRLAVYREMQADLWYEEPEPGEQPTSDAIVVPELASLRRNGIRPKVTAAVSGAV